jgi:GST-like protein
MRHQGASDTLRQETSMIELFGMSSPNVRKVVILLEELRLPWRFRFVDVFRGHQFMPEFLALSPLSKVPVIVDHGNAGCTVFESGAILFYLAERHGRFLPGEGPTRYETLGWLMAQMASIGPMFGQHNHFRFIRKDRDSYAARRYHDQAARLYAILEARLSNQPWLAGDAYSIADMALYPWALYLERHGFSWAAHVHLQRWCESIGTRDATRRHDEFFATWEKTDREAMNSLSPAELDRFMWASPSGYPPSRA